MRTHLSSVSKAALFIWIILGASLLSVPQSATAAVFNVTASAWGTPTIPNSFAWAIDQANTRAGLDTISIAAGLEINVDVDFGLPGDLTWLANFTESVNVLGNGAKLIGNPSYVTSGNLFATKTSIVSNAYRPAIRSTDFVVQRALSFAKIGTFGADNSSIEVTFTDLSADGLASISNVYEGAQLSVSGGDFDNIVNYSQTDDTGRGVFEAYAGSTLNLNDISITRSYPFANALDVNNEAALFFGTIQGVDAQLNMENSSINSSYGAGAVAWSGGTANIVSSVIKDAGGLQINQGVLNFVNSILYMTGGDSLSQTNRIQAASGGEANITASSILYDPLSTSVLCTNVSYECNGMPLTALLNGVLNFDSSVAVPINTSLAFPGKDSYREYTGGDLRADQYSFIGATDNQDASAVRALFDNPSILTEGDTYDIQDFGVIQLFNNLPSGAIPLSSGVLASVIPNAGSGGSNELINPIDSTPILLDVYGQPRTHTAGFRDIGAVQTYPTYVITVSVTGLLGSGLTQDSVKLENNGGDSILVNANATVSFPVEYPDGATYDITVASQPNTQTCTVANGTGTVSGPVTSPSVTCVDNEYTLGGLLSGLEPGDSVVLQNNASDSLTLTADGVFTFPSTLNFGDTYDATVLTQPPAPSETCTVTNGNGTMPASDVRNVSVTCVVDTFTIGGTLTGLFSGGSVVLQINGSHDQALTADGNFVFPALADGTDYAVTVATQPTGQSCSVNNGSGTVAGANIFNVQVSCVNETYNLGGLLTGLAAGDLVVLQNNGGDDLTLAADGSFTFNAPVAFGDPYAVTVKTQPTAPSETCTVSNGSGIMPANDFNGVSVNCTVDTFTVGGSLTGLFSGASVVLQINGSNDQTLTADGNFVFPALADGTDYAVTVATQPTGQSCSVNNGSGTVAGANIFNVQVSCVNETYNLGGLLTGLAAGDLVVLQNNGGDDLTLAADGSFTFNAPVAFGDPYAVTVKTQPTAPSETCTVSNGSGIMPANDFNGVSVNCTVDTFTVGGSLTGLFSGASVVLQINGSNDQTLTADGNFVFPALADGTDYAVTVATQPTGQSCSVNNGSGTVAGANISNVQVSCTLFFERVPLPVPALDRSSLMLLALLMLGVGFIGVRRIA